MNTDQPVQLDLFGQVEATEQAAAADSVRRQIDALTCLRDSVPDALHVLVHLDYWRRADDRGCPGNSGEWAYRIGRAGMDFVRKGTAGGWDRGRALIAWDELRDLLAGHPLRGQVVAWSESLTHPDAWRDRGRPFELWPHPETWHPSYIEGDHTRAGWDDRRHAWAVTQLIYTSAIDRLAAGPHKHAP